VTRERALQAYGCTGLVSHANTSYIHAIYATRKQRTAQSSLHALASHHDLCDELRLSSISSISAGFLSVNSPELIVVGLVGLEGLELPLTVTISVSRISAMVSARFSVN